MVTAHETGGRWSEEAWQFLCQLAFARARTAAPVLRAAAARGWVKRWSTLLALAAQTALASSLLYGTAETHLDGPCPTLDAVLTGDRLGDGPAFSRVPARSWQ